MSFVFALCAMLFALCRLAPKRSSRRKSPRIGYPRPAQPFHSVGSLEAFRQGLRDLGYVEGKNIVIE